MIDARYRAARHTLFSRNISVTRVDNSVVPCSALQLLLREDRIYVLLVTTGSGEQLGDPIVMEYISDTEPLIPIQDETEEMKIYNSLLELLDPAHGNHLTDES